MKQLLSYEQSPEQSSFNCTGTTYLLKIKRSLIFGLISDTYETKYIIPYSHDETNYTEHWDNMIETKTQF